eukprot:SAG11_NODE_2258_length_3613_cov_1.480364_3_plen_306_part_00
MPRSQPTVTFDESDALRTFLVDELAQPAAARAQGKARRRALRQALADLEEMVSDSQPLCDAYAGVYTSRRAFFSPAQCARIVAAAEAHAAAHGWTTRRHVAYPTHDLPSDVLGKVGPLLRQVVGAQLLPELAGRFALEVEQLSIQDMFVAKYEAAPNGLRSLAEHEDGSEFSFVLALNAGEAYTGGGTEFVALAGRPVFRPALGHGALLAVAEHCGVSADLMWAQLHRSDALFGQEPPPWGRDHGGNSVHPGWFSEVRRQRWARSFRRDDCAPAVSCVSTRKEPGGSKRTHFGFLWRLDPPIVSF